LSELLDAASLCFLHIRLFLSTNFTEAIADEDYFDWPVLPEVPSSLNAALAGKAVKLSWQVHEGNPTHILVERRVEQGGEQIMAAHRGTGARRIRLCRLPCEQGSAGGIPRTCF
jgi:hypothetical protein